MMRSREETLIDGEKPTRYFYALERINKSKSTINKLTINQPSPNNNQNNLISLTDQSEILNEIHKYHTNIFSKQSLDAELQDELLSNVTHKLPSNIKNQMDKSITKEELTLVIQLFKRNKSPGIDGLPIEFYIKFWPLIANAFTKLANNVYDNGLLTDA